MNHEMDAAGEHCVDSSTIDRHGLVGIAIAVVLALLLSILTIAGTAAAIDQVAIVSPDRTTVEAAPGETIEIDVSLRSQGGHGGEGVEAVTLVARYHPDHLERISVDRGAWLEGDETEIDATETIAHERGTAILEQRRDPAAGGTTGTGTIATVTVRIAEDAPAGTTTISFGESEVDLTGDWPVAVVDESATVAIDGGNESLGSFDHPDPDEIDRESPGSSPGDDSAGSGSEPADEDGSEPVPGFSGGVAILAVLLVALRLATARDGHRE
ncbi:cohesin domain-containing protein [Natrinema salsiterrestre]|uniref:Cohesin domain-containing protein n=1 Tax=Natrinema salsiterrestre TaxID=2950540 RepID=A0A9Q4L257_9EURY|nr:cohesin domain-containing protein [Natrinema salsiterrestre]MDF9745468.1 cohesin domain-containing protein [Natrinema salsiterrestre]